MWARFNHIWVSFQGISRQRGCGGRAPTKQQAYRACGIKGQSFAPQYLAEGQAFLPLFCLKRGLSLCTRAISLVPTILGRFPIKRAKSTGNTHQNKEISKESTIHKQLHYFYAHFPFVLGNFPRMQAILLELCTKHLNQAISCAKPLYLQLNPLFHRQFYTEESRPQD